MLLLLLPVQFLCLLYQVKERKLYPEPKKTQRPVVREAASNGDLSNAWGSKYCHSQHQRPGHASVVLKSKAKALVIYLPKKPSHFVHFFSSKLPFFGWIANKVLFDFFFDPQKLHLFLLCKKVPGEMNFGRGV